MARDQRRGNQSVASHIPQLRRRDRPAQTPGTRLGRPIELEQTGRTFFQLDARVFDVGHQPRRENSEVRLVAHGGNDLHVTVSSEPLDEVTHWRAGRERLRRLDAIELERVSDDLRRLPRTDQRTRREQVDRIDRAMNSPRVERHLATTLVRERALVVAMTGPRPNLLFFGDPVSDEE